MVDIVASVRCWFQAYSHLGEKGRVWGGGWGGTLIFSNIRRPGPFLGLTFWYFVMTPKDIHKIFIPQKIFIFLKTLKGIEIQNFEPQNGASLRMNENIIVPPLPPPLRPLLADRNRGRGRPDSNNRKKTLIRVFIVVFFCNYIIFFTVQKGRNIYRGWGGGCNFLLLFFFCWGGGGWGGVQILISIETYITCDFSGGGGGGGGGSGPPIPLWIRAWVRNK